MHKRYLSSIFFLLLLLAGQTSAQDFWAPANNGMDGAWVRALAVGPSGSMYAATDIGIYRSADGGKHWSLVDTLVAEALAVAPNGNIFIATQRGLYRSTNGGTLWDRVSTTSEVRTIMVDANGGILAGGTFGLYRSTDGGSHWQKTGSASGINHIIVDSIGVLYAATEDGLYRSMDNGVVWDRIMWLDEFYGIIQSVALAADGAIIAAAKLGVYRSSDGGESWNRVSELQGGLLHAARNGHLFMCVDFSGVLKFRSNGLYRSTDGGITWRQMNNLIASVIISGANGDLFTNGSRDLFRSTDDGDSWLHTDAGMRNYSAGLGADTLGRLYAVRENSRAPLHAYQLFSSTDNGNSWTLLKDTIFGTYAIMPDGQIWGRMDKVSTFPPDEIVREESTIYSRDQGMTWTSFGRGRASIVRKGGRMVVGLTVNDPRGISSPTGEVAYSDDNGLTWRRTPMPGAFSAIEILPGGAAFAGIYTPTDHSLGTGSLYRTTDAGRTWQLLRDKFFSYSILALDDSTVYLGASEVLWDDSHSPLRIYRSTDAGETWSIIRDSLDAGGVSLKSGDGWIGYNAMKGFERSTDGGATWELIPYNSDSVTPLTPMQRPEIFGKNDRGIYRSTDNGASWALLESGLPRNRGSQYYFMARSGYFFGTIINHGIFRSTRASSIRNEEKRSYDLRLWLR